jgi:hypothetical protein
VSVTLVTKLPWSRWLNRLITILARTSAGILIVLSFVASISLCLFLPAVIPWFRRYIEWLPAVVVAHLGYSVLVALAIIGAGALTVPLARYNRREVLFLRRFGDAETAHAVTDALPTIGRSWRIVALDDRTLKPVSASREFRWTAWVDPFFDLSLSAAGGLFGLAQAVGYPTLALLGFMLWRSEGTQAQRWQGILHGGGLLHAVGRVGIEMSIFLLVAAIVFFILRWSMMPAFAITFALGSADDADESSRGSIRFQDDIFRTQKAIRRNAKRTVAARIAVVTVSDDLWRESVARLADDAAVVLVDVSHPSEHVIWEVEYLLTAGIPCAFVGAAPRLSYLTDYSFDGEFEAILRDRLDGRTVVSYVPSGRESARRDFARALRASFERLGKRNPPRYDGVYRAQQYMVNRRLNKAIDIFEKIAAWRQQTLGPEHAVTLSALRDLATAYQAAKRYDEACALFQRILGVWEKQAHDDEADAARLGARESLANSYDVAGRTADARRLRTQNVDDARESLAGRPRALESGDPMTLRAARNLANACQAAGLHDEAISLFKDNLEACLRRGETSRRDIAILEARDDLARAYSKAGQVAEALRLHKNNENAAERILGRNHPMTQEFYRSRVRSWQATRPPSKPVRGGQRRGRR